MEKIFESEVLFTSESNGIIMSVKYVSDHTYLVEVSTENDGIHVTLSRVIPATFEPLYGIDVSDMDRILLVGEELAVELETNYEFISEDEDEG